MSLSRFEDRRCAVAEAEYLVALGGEAPTMLFAALLLGCLGAAR